MSEIEKSNVSYDGSKQGDSESIKEFREKMAKARGEFEEALRRSREARAEVDAVLGISSR
jgi:hypothetical protein